MTSTVFHCSLLYQAPLTSADTLTLAGSVNIKNGNGSGSVSVSARRVMSHRAWGSVSVSLRYYCAVNAKAVELVEMYSPNRKPYIYMDLLNFTKMGFPDIDHCVNAKLFLSSLRKNPVVHWILNHMHAETVSNLQQVISKQFIMIITLLNHY